MVGGQQCGVLDWAATGTTRLARSPVFANREWALTMVLSKGCKVAYCMGTYK